MYYALVSPDDTIRQFVLASDQAAADAQCRDGETAVEYDGAYPKSGATFLEGEIVYQPPTLDERKVAKWRYAITIRDRIKSGGCMTPLGRVDTTDEAQRNIFGAVAAATIARIKDQPFSRDWTMADNTVVTHDREAMLDMGVAVAAFADACHIASNAIRAQIDASTDVDTLDNIDVTAGYPSS